MPRCAEFWKLSRKLVVRILPLVMLNCRRVRLLPNQLRLVFAEEGSLSTTFRSYCRSRALKYHTRPLTIGPENVARVVASLSLSLLGNSHEGRKFVAQKRNRTSRRP